MNSFTALLDEARTPWDLYKAFKELPDLVMDFARERAEADQNLMKKLIENPLGADDLWPARELCVLLSDHQNMVPAMSMVAHFLAEYPVFLMQSDEPELNFLVEMCQKAVRAISVLSAILFSPPRALNLIFLSFYSPI